MKLKTLKQIIAKCEVPDGFLFVNSILYSSPVEGVITGYYFEKVGGGFYIWLYLQPLSLLSEGVNFTFSKRLAGSNGACKFSLENSDYFKTVDEVNLVLNSEEYLLLIRDLKSSDKFYAFFEKSKYTFNELETMSFLSMYLSRENSIEMISDLESLTKKYLAETERDYLGEIIVNCEQIKLANPGERRSIFDSWRMKMLDRIIYGEVAKS